MDKCILFDSNDLFLQWVLSPWKYSVHMFIIIKLVLFTFFRCLTTSWYSIVPLILWSLSSCLRLHPWLPLSWYCWILQFNWFLSSRRLVSRFSRDRSHLLFLDLLALLNLITWCLFWNWVGLLLNVYLWLWNVWFQSFGRRTFSSWYIQNSFYLDIIGLMIWRCVIKDVFLFDRLTLVQGVSLWLRLLRVL